MTPYETVYERFAQKITDLDLADLTDDELSQMLYGWMRSAIRQSRYLGEGLTLDDDNQQFSNTLTDVQIEVFALGMVLEWLRPQVYSVNLTHQMYGGKEEKWFSQASHLSTLNDTLARVKLDRDRLIRDYGMYHNPYLGTEEKTTTDGNGTNG